jgi:hypothetical protein
MTTPISGLDILLWGVLPYVTIAIYIVYRSRSGGPATRRPRRGWERVG